jgi:hypothetical protein
MNGCRSDPIRGQSPTLPMPLPEPPRTTLRHAVNRVTSAGAPDSHLKAAITRAISVLHQKPDTTPPKTDDIFDWAYQDANFGGASIFADLVPGWVYWRIPYRNNRGDVSCH